MMINVALHHHIPLQGPLNRVPALIGCGKGKDVTSACRVAGDTVPNLKFLSSSNTATRKKRELHKIQKIAHEKACNRVTTINDT